MSEERTFEDLVAELERTAQAMASGVIGIEEVAALYERAGVLHAEATARLDAVHLRLAALTDPAPPSPQTWTDSG